MEFWGDKINDQLCEVFILATMEKTYVATDEQFEMMKNSLFDNINW